MKVWIKYLIGIFLGICIGFAVPENNDFINSMIDFLSDFAIRFGRYSLYPVLFFSFTVSIFNLRENKNLFKLGFSTSSFIVISALFFSFFGLITVLIGSPSRIPIFVEGALQVQPFSIKSAFLELFPSSAFEAFTNGLYILPLCILGGFAGAGCAVDKTISKPALTLFDSLAKTSYSVMVFFVDVFSIGLIAVSVHWTMSFKNMLATKFFTDFIILLFVDFFVIVLLIVPAIIKVFCRDINPYRILYASIAPAAAAFMSGDTNSTLPVLMRHSNESLGIRRRISSVSLPVFSIFGRAGSAMIVTISFIVILKSYSSLGISIKDMIWLCIISAFFSFLLGQIPMGGTYAALAAICTIYGRGFESGFLILRPAAFLLGSIAAAIDAVIAMAGTYIIAHRSNMSNVRDLRFFI